jgi:spectrin beta
MTELSRKMTHALIVLRVAVLCGQLLCFFRDHDDFLASKAATSPIIVFKARCEKAEDYTKRKHVFR